MVHHARERSGSVDLIMNVAMGASMPFNAVSRMILILQTPQFNSSKHFVSETGRWQQWFASGVNTVCRSGCVLDRSQALRLPLSQ